MINKTTHTHTHKHLTTPNYSQTKIKFDTMDERQNIDCLNLVKRVMNVDKQNKLIELNVHKNAHTHIFLIERIKLKYQIVTHI